MSPNNSQDDFDPKPGRIGGGKKGHSERYVTQVMRPLGRAERGRRRLGHISPNATFNRGVGAGVRAAAGLIAPDGRRVVAWARYMIIAGRLHSARLHLKYIVREGVGRDGSKGRAYDAASDNANVDEFVRRSAGDRYQFRFLVSAEDGARLTDLKAFIRDFMVQVQYDLDTRLDWLAADHFNTGYPHTHIVIFAVATIRTKTSSSPTTTSAMDCAPARGHWSASSSDRKASWNDCTSSSTR